MDVIDRALSVPKPYLQLISEVDGSFSWVNGEHYKDAVDRARAAVEAWDLGLEGQAHAQLGELCKLALKDYMLRYAARVMFEDLPGRRYPLETAQVIIPARLLVLVNRLRRFPLRECFDFETVRPVMGVLVTNRDEYYLRFPYVGEICLID